MTAIPDPVEDWAGFDAFVKTIEASSPGLAQVMLGIAELSLQIADHDQTPRAWATQLKEDLEEVIDRADAFLKDPPVITDQAIAQELEDAVRLVLKVSKGKVSQLDQTLAGWDAGRAADVRAGYIDPIDQLTKMIREDSGLASILELIHDRKDPNQ